jgi:hypothetical protein
MALKENYKDDILDVSVNTKRKYRMTENPDGTVSFDDETEYTQEGDSFGASDMNATNGKVNTLESDIGEINDNLTASKYTDTNATTLEALTNSFINSIHSSMLENSTIRRKITNNANLWYGIEITKYGANIYNGIILNLSNAEERYTFRSSIGSGGASTVISPFKSYLGVASKIYDERVLSHTYTITQGDVDYYKALIFVNYRIHSSVDSVPTITGADYNFDLSFDSQRGVKVGIVTDLEVGKSVSMSYSGNPGQAYRCTVLGIN